MLGLQSFTHVKGGNRGRAWWELHRRQEVGIGEESGGNHSWGVYRECFWGLLKYVIFWEKLLRIFGRRYRTSRRSWEASLYSCFLIAISFPVNLHLVLFFWLLWTFMVLHININVAVVVSPKRKKHSPYTRCPTKKKDNIWPNKIQHLSPKATIWEPPCCHKDLRTSIRTHYLKNKFYSRKVMHITLFLLRNALMFGSVRRYLPSTVGYYYTKTALFIIFLYRKTYRTLNNWLTCFRPQTRRKKIRRRDLMH